MRSLFSSIKNALCRAGGGFAAEHQGEYLHGWLPAMSGRAQLAINRVETPVEQKSTADDAQLGHASHAGVC